MYQVNISLSKIKYISKKIQIMTIIRIKNYMLDTLVGNCCQAEHVLVAQWYRICLPMQET